MNKKLIIWDWNGTLFDDAWLCVDVMNDTLRQRGLEPLTLERYARLFTFPVREYYRALGFDFARESFETCGTEFILAYEKRRLECTLQPHAVDTLTALRRAGCRQAVLSAYREETLLQLLEHFRLLPFFEAWSGLDNHYAHGKLDNGHRLLARLGVPPKDVLLVGDTLHDADVAAAMGVDAVLLDAGHTDLPRLRKTGLPLLKCLDELPRWLNEEAARHGG